MPSTSCLCRAPCESLPAVIASTTSRWVVSVRLNSATFWPRRSTVMRSATSKTSCMLCEISMTREALLGQPPDQVEHLPGLGDAERGGRLVEDDQLGVPHHGLGDRDRLALAAGQAGDGLAHRVDRGHREVASVSRARASISASSRRRNATRLAAQEHVLDDVEVVAQREVLVDDLDARARPRPSGPWIVTGSPSKRTSPSSIGIDPRDALDERGLARAVVADQRHDLARRRRGSRPRTAPGRRRSASNAPAARGAAASLTVFAPPRSGCGPVGRRERPGAPSSRR